MTSNPTPNRRATMQDVARAARVSVSTVSHVLNQTRAVLPETERAVREAIAETGYVQDQLARSLRTGTSNFIGLAMSAISNQYFSKLVAALESHFSSAGYSILLADTHDEPQQELRAAKDLLAHRPAGLVLAPSSQPEAVIDYLQQHDIPLVCVDRCLAGYDHVGVENLESAQELYRHAASHGHTRIGVIVGRRGLVTSEERLEGCLLGAASAQTDADPQLFVDGDSTEEGARAATSALLALPHPPTAIVTLNNRMTIGALTAIKQRGLSVPGDIALLGFDDFDWADFFEPRLTTLAQPLDEIADYVVSRLAARIQEPYGQPEHIRLAPKLMLRNSCGCR